MKNYLTAILWICAIAAHPVFSGEQPAVKTASNTIEGQNYTCEKWAVLDMVFTAGANTNNPLEAEFATELTHESGQTLNILGFYNDSKSWVIRFSPSIEGIWRYKTYSSVSSLAGLTGEVKVGPNTKTGRHGPIKISDKNKQRFEYEDGTSYFPLAFEIDWLFALDTENEQDIPKTRTIVRHLADYKFNKVIMNVFACDAGFGDKKSIDPKYNFAKPAVFPFGGTNEKPDHNTLNIDFFKHFDRVMACLDKNEIVSHLMIYVWNKKVNWPKPGSKQDDLYFDYVVKRYQAYPNLIWDISKEALAYGMDDMNYISERIDRLRKLDGHKRLVTVHDYQYCRSFPEKIDFISVQEWRPNLYNTLLDIAAKHPAKPVYNVEHGGYEKTMHSIFNGAYTDPVACLDRNYQCIFAGVYSTYYWQNAAWYELVYEPFALEPEKQPHFGYYRVLMEFFSGYDYNTLIPIQHSSSPYGLTNNKDTFLYYITRDTIALEGMAPPQTRGKKIEIKWFNPLTGEYSPKEVRTIGSSPGAWIGIRKPAGITSPIAIVILKIIEK